MKSNAYVIFDTKENLVGVADDEYTKDKYKDKGYKVVKTKILKEVNANVSEVQFSILRTCHDGYECSGETSEYEGTIIDILDDAMYLELKTEKLNDDYIPFGQFLINADMSNTERGYDGEITLSNLADMFISQCDTRDNEYRCLSSSCTVEKKDIIEYLDSLFIDKKNHSYSRLYGLN